MADRKSRLNYSRQCAQHLFLAVLLTITSTSNAASLPELVKLFENREFTEAYEMSKRLEHELIGDDKFDFIYGQSALETGHIDEASITFERILMTKPNNDRVRLDLAVTYYSSGRYDLALNEFNRVKTRNPPINVLTKINRFVNDIQERMNRREHLTQYSIEYSLGHDSNANNATSLKIINIPALGIPMELSDSMMETADYFGQTQVNFSSTNILNKRANYVLAFSYQNRQNFAHQYLNTSSFMIDNGFMYAASRDAVINILPLRLSQTWLDGKEFRYGALSTVSAASQWDDQVSTLFFANISKQMFDRDTDQLNDKIDWLFGGNVTKTMNNGTFTPGASFFGGSENIADDRYKYLGRHYAGLGGNFTQLLDAENSIYIQFSAQTGLYQGNHPLFATKRADNIYQAETGWVNQAWKQWKITTQAIFTANESNIGYYYFRKSQFLVNVRYSS